MVDALGCWWAAITWLSSINAEERVAGTVWPGCTAWHGALTARKAMPNLAMKTAAIKTIQWAGGMMVAGAVKMM